MAKVFEEFINENNFQTVIGDGVVNFKLFAPSRTGTIGVLAANSKELDKLIELDLSELEVGRLIESTMNDQLKKYKESIKVVYDTGYQGAGYSFYVDLEDILKKLNK